MNKTVDRKERRLGLSFVDDSIILDVYLYQKDIVLTEWPAALIASNLDDKFGEEITDTLPAYEGNNNGFYVYSDCIVVLLGKNGEQAMGDYEIVLAENYFEKTDEHQFVSPNKQYQVFLECTYDDTSFKIYLTDVAPDTPTYNYFPVDELKAAFFKS